MEQTFSLDSWPTKHTLGSFFRPCMELHDGKVEQIVGGKLKAEPRLAHEFRLRRSSAYYSEIIIATDVTGGHVIILGLGNEESGRAALRGGGLIRRASYRWGASILICSELPSAAPLSHVIVHRGYFQRK